MTLAAHLEAGELWWKNAIVYCLDVETFSDSDGDGVGDLQGLIQRLDHLAAMGVSCLWLLPVHPSPNRDDGYDVTDFYGLDPRLGTLGDFVTFVRSAGERGIRVLIDLVVNHTSDEHPWFRESRSSRNAARRDWYVWAEEPDHAVEKVIFPGEQEGNWAFDEGSGQWYFHRFHPFQPDLNMANPDVRAELMQIMGFWLELGVSGFRIDAVPFLIQDMQDEEEPGRERHEWLRELRAFVERRRADAILIGEANIPVTEMAGYFGAADETHMLFNYRQNASLLAALATGTARPVEEYLDEIPDVPHLCGWLNFTRIHDEANLERLDDADRKAVFEAFAPEESMRIYGRGLRRRLPEMLERDRARLELAYVLMFAAPGTPMLLYGEEIAMGDNLDLDGRLSVRTPMQWTSGPTGGFTTADPARLVRPLATTGGPDEANVADQRRDPGSFLHWLARLIAARRSTRAMGLGPVTRIRTGFDDVIAWRFDRQAEHIVCVHNLSADSRRVPLDRLGPIDRGADLFLSCAPDEDVPCDGHVELEPYGYRWWNVPAGPDEGFGREAHG